ncbi:DUF3489 domain-containing protein [Hydrogenophaga sp. BPS33]|uniref:DUF3489 domain-containing protein n=1 Tax=Hydrogenophaga sp. BPS33 TaxID=2651974 RepID=UPI00131F95B3|nr:DUF3489 domain-containing protein [Hydrogenophaga sp. BPS33]QHE84875.1 DUF3489 domain-containing protein [Hydrogenophaga sp. BPS33]
MKRSSSSTAKSKSVPAKRRAPSKPKTASRPTKAFAAKFSAKPLVKAAAKTARASQKSAPAADPSAVLDPSKSKQSQLIALLGAASGASMVQMTSLTGWLPHTVRGTISAALRKRLGLNVQCQMEEGVRIYRIAGAVTL